MSVKQSLREASLHSLTIFFGALGGLLGLLVMAMTEGWLPVPLGIAAGLYVALFLAYDNVRSDRDSLKSRMVTKEGSHAIADALTELLLDGRVVGACPLFDEEDFLDFRRRCHAWVSDVAQTMAVLGCHKHEVSAVINPLHSEIQKAPEFNEYPNALWNEKKRLQGVRLDKLSTVIRRYGDGATK